MPDAFGINKAINGGAEIMHPTLERAKEMQLTVRFRYVATMLLDGFGFLFSSVAG